MLLQIDSPSNCRNEREYLFDLVFNHFLGVQYELRFDNRDSVDISIEHSVISVPDVFFALVESDWLNPSAIDLPTRPEYIEQGNSNDDLPIPVWFYQGDPPRSITSPLNRAGREHVNSVGFNFDLLGSIFFLISRYEELQNTELDVHQRFPLSSSVLSTDNLIRRPLVNEYVELLCNQIRNITSAITFKDHAFKQTITCDVDYISFPPVNSSFDVVKYLGSQAIKKKSIRVPLEHAFQILRQKNQWIQPRSLQ